MDPFTQRMLERARARQEKIDQKLTNSGQIVPKRKPLLENVLIKDVSPAKSPVKANRESIVSPRKLLKSESPVKVANRRPSIKEIVPASVKPRNDVIVTKKEFRSPKTSLNRRNSDVSVEINISHRNDIQIEVQVEERDAPISIVYDPECDHGSNIVIKEIEEDKSDRPKENTLTDGPDTGDHKNERSGLRHNMKSRLDRLGNLYSDKPNLSSPIHRTEQQFTAGTPPTKPSEPKVDGKKKFGRLAALADQINNWEDDLTHHTFQQPEPVKKQPERRYGRKPEPRTENLNASTLDVSIHSINDINKALQTTSKTSQASKSGSNECQRLKKEIVAELKAPPPPKSQLMTFL